MPSKPRPGSRVLGPPVLPHNIEPVTVLDVLKAIGLKNGTCPNLNNPAVAHLSHVLSLIRLKVQGTRVGEDWVQSGVPAAGQEGVSFSDMGNPCMQLHVFERRAYAALGKRPSNNPMLEVMDAQEAQRRLDELREDKRLADKGLRLEDDRTARRLRDEIRSQEEKVAHLGPTMPEFYERRRAERDARQRAFKSAQPILDKCEVAKKRKAAKWTHFAQELDAIFDTALPGQSMDAADRFIAAVVPAITGEKTNPNAIAQFFKYRRVKRRERESKVNRRRV
jgi:hypothetical protein